MTRGLKWENIVTQRLRCILWRFLVMTHRASYSLPVFRAASGKSRITPLFYDAFVIIFATISGLLLFSFFLLYDRANQTIPIRPTIAKGLLRQSGNLLDFLSLTKYSSLQTNNNIVLVDNYFPNFQPPLFIEPKIKY